MAPGVAPWGIFAGGGVGGCMKYEIRLPASAGDVAPIGVVADAMALRDASAGGHDPLPATRAGRHARYLAMLLSNVRSGKLAVCDDVGEPWEPESLVRHRTADGGGVELQADLTTVDVDATWSVNVFVKLKVLNEWAAQRGDEFTISDKGVRWIEADLWVSQDGESRFDVRQRGEASELGQRSANDVAAQAQPVRAHRIGRDLLAPVIKRAQDATADSADTAQVMAELERLARLPERERPAPLAGATSGGVQWRDGGAVKMLTRKALGMRMKRFAASPR